MTKSTVLFLTILNIDLNKPELHDKLIYEPVNLTKPKYNLTKSTSKKLKKKLKQSYFWIKW
jgi:hypothetical protein